MRQWPEKESPLVDKLKHAATEGKVALPPCTVCFEAKEPPVLVRCPSNNVNEELSLERKKARKLPQNAEERER